MENKMNTRKLLTYYGIFGCWTQFIPGLVGRVLFTAWLFIILFWIIVNAGGIFLYLTDKLELTKNAERALDPGMFNMWYVAALASFIVCGEYVVAVTFLFTSCFFAYLTQKALQDKENAAPKKKVTKK